MHYYIQDVFCHKTLYSSFVNLANTKQVITMNILQYSKGHIKTVLSFFHIVVYILNGRGVTLY